MSEKLLEAALPDDLIGSRVPSLRVIAPYDYSEGPDALRLSELAGLELDPWQQDTVIDAMGVRNGIWSAFEVGIEASRRNGKSKIGEVRCLAGLYLLRETRIVWSAHRGDTAMEAFGRMLTLIEAHPSFKRELAYRGVKTGNGKESIKLRSGATMVFKTRISGGGRGLDGDFVVIDEVQDAQEDHLASLLPTMAARRNPQVWYMGSAGGPDSYVQGSLVHRARNTDPDASERRRFTYFAWSASEDDDPSQVETWAKGNPGLGKRLQVETMAGLYRAMKFMPEKFAREHLGIGDYPRPAGEDWVIPQSVWKKMTDEESQPSGPVLFAADAKPDQSWASISIAGLRRDGATHLEVVDHARGTLWIPTRLAQVMSDHEHVGPVVIDPKGPLGHLIPDIQALGIEVHLLDAGDVASASEWLISIAAEHDATENVDDWRPRILHRGQIPLTAALASATTRKLADRIALSRRGPSDISPVMSACFAGWALQKLGRPIEPPPAPVPVRSSPGARATGTGDLMRTQF